MDTIDLEGLRCSTVFIERLQTITVRGRKVQKELTFNNFEEIVTTLFNIDKNCTIFPWWYRNSEGLSKLNMNRNMSTNKRELLVYVYTRFLKEDSYPYIRLLVGHSKKRKYLNSVAMEEAHHKHIMYVNVDKLQAKETLCIGLLIESHLKVANAVNL